MNDSRQSYEARFPVPDGVIWNEDFRTYIVDPMAAPKFASEPLLNRACYQQGWVAWNARAQADSVLSAKVRELLQTHQFVPKEPTDEMIDAFSNTPKMKVIDGMISTTQIRAGYAEERLACKTKQDSAVGEGLRAAITAAPDPLADLIAKEGQ